MLVGNLFRHFFAATKLQESEESITINSHTYLRKKWNFETDEVGKRNLRYL